MGGRATVRLRRTVWGPIQRLIALLLSDLGLATTYEPSRICGHEGLL